MNLLKAITKRQYVIYSVFSFTVLAIFNSQNVSANFNDRVENALKFGYENGKYGQIKIDIRYRFENTNTKISTRKTATADTIRLRLGYLTPEFYGLQAYVEYEGNQDVFNNNYNSIRNGKGNYDVIADPQQNELNQLWFTYTGITDTEIKVGR